MLAVTLDSHQILNDYVVSIWRVSNGDLRVIYALPSAAHPPSRGARTVEAHQFQANA